ncbi:hypothetical protein DSCO28_04270 [Desulfosarcina ovata subsp. sediminis]|uniref:Uncharacterized protein n=1 Tax=Desulfosarcina ovata subsp. sediminis TaxID=885957 RepID=A0A5K7ZG16_9BACT|nr:hypothetical protein DSCO28_04270 [Desulfosarcina ovata subsp. sediminis]
MGGKMNRVKAFQDNLATSMTTLTIDWTPVTADRNASKIVETIVIGGKSQNVNLTAIERIEIITTIAVTENALMIEAAIMVTTNIKETDLNITAIGVHGTSGTGMREDIPKYTNMDNITVIMPI